ncbi:sialidase family protein [Halobacterium zhouii]|uniref:sialidase family protein n=1 Tax=Halobacterium zhouii TaxID=2902624 RepID=UPI001E3E28CB|nr:WD40 repeat domain-containing protein [Halobacterium zhouii]
MLLAGSGDGLYRLTGVGRAAETNAQQVLDAGAVARVRTFEGVDGVFAATETGLYHSPGGDEWTNLGVPRENVYAVGASPDGRVYAGTRPAHVYVAQTSGGEQANDGAASLGELAWRELEAFQELPSRDEWRLPRHENLAQVRDLNVHPDEPDRVVAGVEVGGVHVSDDGGETWTERRGAGGTDGESDVEAGNESGVDDDVHELAVVGPDEFVAATGFGLFRTTDAGRSWTRLDDGYEQRYFRSVCAVDGDVYAGSALAHTSTWDDEDANPALFACRDGETLEQVDLPRSDETVTGLTGIDSGVDEDDQVVAATHRGTVLAEQPDGWVVAGSIPATDGFAGSYTPLLWVEG